MSDLPPPSPDPIDVGELEARLSWLGEEIRGTDADWKTDDNGDIHAISDAIREAVPLLSRSRQVDGLVEALREVEGYLTEYKREVGSLLGPGGRSEKLLAKVTAALTATTGEQGS